MPEESQLFPWNPIPLAAIFRINTAAAFPSQSPNEFFTHYSIPAFDKLGGPANELGLTIESNKTSITEPSVLVSKLNPRKPRVVAVLDPKDRTCCSTEFVCYVPLRESDDLRYWSAYFGSGEFSRRLERVAVGSTNSHTRVSPSETLKWLVPDVPAGEQKLIADILDAIDDAILETDAVIEKLRTVHVGIIDDLLTRGLSDDGSPRKLSDLVATKVGPRPPTWTVENLGRFVVGAEYGTNLSLGDSSAGIPVLRMNNIQDGEFDLADMKYAPAHAVERFRLQRNDVLFNRTNSWEHVGKAAIWRRDEPGPAFASYLVRLHCGDALLPEFLHLWLNWAPVQRAIRQFATPGVQQVNINPTNLRRALIAVPDTLDEQRAIIERVNGVAAAIEDHRRERAKLSNLREGLRDDLLTGRKPVVAIREAAE
jgi:type I restriction enzyme S subunit